MSEEVHIMAILTPKPGKVERLKELFGPMCQSVHSKEEDFTSRYIMSEQLDAETPKIVMFETYKDKASADKHVKTDHFTAFFKQVTDEGILAEAPFLAQTVTRAGFDKDRKLVQMS